MSGLLVAATRTPAELSPMDDAVISEADVFGASKNMCAPGPPQRALITAPEPVLRVTGSHASQTNGSGVPAHRPLADPKQQVIGNGVLLHRARADQNQALTVNRDPLSVENHAGGHHTLLVPADQDMKHTMDLEPQRPKQFVSFRPDNVEKMVYAAGLSAPEPIYLDWHVASSSYFFFVMQFLQSIAPCGSKCTS